MEIFSKTFGLLLILALLGALGAGGYWGFQYIAALFGSMNPQVAAVTAVGSVVILLAALIVASATRSASKQDKANFFLSEKSGAYELFIDFWANLLQKGAIDKSPAYLPEALQDLSRQLAIYGSAALIEIHTQLQTLKREGKVNDMQNQLAKGLLQIRKELGVASEEIADGEMEQLLFPSFDNLTKEAKEKEGTYVNGTSEKISTGHC